MKIAGTNFSFQQIFSFVYYFRPILFVLRKSCHTKKCFTGLFFIIVHKSTDKLLVLGPSLIFSEFCFLEGFSLHSLFCWLLGCCGERDFFVGINPFFLSTMLSLSRIYLTYLEVFAMMRIAFRCWEIIKVSLVPKTARDELSLIHLQLVIVWLTWWFGLECLIYKHAFRFSQ